MLRRVCGVVILLIYATFIFMIAELCSCEMKSYRTTLYCMVWVWLVLFQYQVCILYFHRDMSVCGIPYDSVLYCFHRSYSLSYSGLSRSSGYFTVWYYSTMNCIVRTVLPWVILHGCRDQQAHDNCVLVLSTHHLSRNRTVLLVRNTR